MWYSAELRCRPKWTFSWLVAALAASCFILGSAAPPMEAQAGSPVLAQPPTLPDPPALASPSDGSQTCNLRPVFVWGRVRQAAFYEIQVDDDAEFGSPVIDQVTDQVFLFTSSDLLDGTWNWRVRAGNDDLTGFWSEPWSVTVLAAPAAPSLLSPSDKSQNCDGTPLLSWTKVDHATAYHVQVDDDAGFGSPVVDASTPNPTYALPVVLRPGVYYWRVQAQNDCDAGVWSAVFRFEVLAPPGVPVLLAPSNGSSTQERTPTFSWGSVDGAASYRIQVDDSQQFDSPLVDAEGTPTLYVPAKGLVNGTYYWRVQALSVCGRGDWSEPWSVRVFNRAPIADDDHYQVNEDSPERELNVLSNDRDPDGDTLRIVYVTQPQYGTASVSEARDRVLYRPDPDYYGEDRLTYTVGDGHGDTDTASVALTVVGINDPPVADAGPDQSVLTSMRVTLDGSGSFDPDGNLPLSFFWTQSGGPPVALSSGVVASPTLIAPGEPCTLTFELFVMDALGKANVAPDQTVIRVYSPTIQLTYLPTVGREHVVAPDLVVQQVTASSGEISAVIVNQGNAPVRDGFFVDLYVDPRPAPKAVNQTWDQLGSQGMVWGVTEPALSNLVPGGSVTLRFGDRYYLADLSSFAGALSPGTSVYVQVDSFNPATLFGTVLERHEIRGGTYNNVYGPVSSTAAVSDKTAAVAGRAYFR